MKAQFEKIRSSSNSFVAFERSDPSFPFVWHYHPEYELTLIVESCGQRFVGDAVANYTSGDLVLLGPGLPHTWRSETQGSGGREKNRAIVVQFRSEFLGKEFFALPEMSAVSQLFSRASCGLAFGSTRTGKEVGATMTGMVALTPVRQLLTLLSILTDLANEAGAQRLSTGRVTAACRAADQQRIETICGYLDHHLGDEIDYPRLAQEVHMDLASLCRFFKRATGRTMTTYVNELRVAAATRLLQETDFSVLEVGLRAGFGNYSNFNRQFKKMKGFRPGLLRQEFQATATAFLPQSNHLWDDSVEK
jgi:AraC-like DNA-binding protein